VVTVKVPVTVASVTVVVTVMLRAPVFVTPAVC